MSCLNCKNKWNHFTDIDAERKKNITVKMDNNVSSTSPVLIFVPQIVMVATYTQDTQTHSITSSISTQTDSNLFNTTTTQTNQITS